MSATTATLDRSEIDHFDKLGGEWWHAGGEFELLHRMNPVRIAFLTTLNREPTEDEIDTWRRQIAVNGIEVVRDLVWVLCNSNEFRFVR